MHHYCPMEAHAVTRLVLCCHFCALVIHDGVGDSYVWDSPNSVHDAVTREGALRLLAEILDGAFPPKSSAKVILSGDVSATVRSVDFG